VVKFFQKQYFYFLKKGIDAVNPADDKNKKGGKNPVKEE
jgi:hypothetical protein